MKVITSDGLSRVLGKIKSALLGKADLDHAHEEIVEQPNLFDKTSSENVEGYYLDSSTGEPTVESYDWMVTHYISVEPNTRYIFDKIWHTVYVAFYDSNKTFISYPDIDGKQILVPSNASFMRAEIRVSEKDTATIKKHTPMSHIESEEMHLTQWQSTKINNSVRIETYTASFTSINVGTATNVDVNGLYDTDNFIAYPVYTSDDTTNIEIQNAWNCIDRLYCDTDGVLTAYCFSKAPSIPSGGLNIELTIFR